MATWVRNELSCRRSSPTASPPDDEGAAATAKTAVACARPEGGRQWVRKAWKMLRKAGPAMMTKRAGMMQKTMGKSILTGAFWASSWASWWRRTRISAAWVRRIDPIETPKTSACLRARTNERTSGTLGSGVERGQGVGPARPGPHLAQHAGELLGQRSRHHGHGPGQSLLETQTRPPR